MVSHEAFRAGAMGHYRDHLITVLGWKIPAVQSAQELIELAKKAGSPEIETRYGWRTDPPFPGATEVPEEMPTGWRMICACHIFEGETYRGIVFTTFVSGRKTTVVINAPGTAVIPDDYKPLWSR
jgi:hypothetical protein